MSIILIARYRMIILRRAHMALRLYFIISQGCLAPGALTSNAILPLGHLEGCPKGLLGTLDIREGGELDNLFLQTKASKNF